MIVVLSIKFDKKNGARSQYLIVLFLPQKLNEKKIILIKPPLLNSDQFLYWEIIYLTL